MTFVPYTVQYHQDGTRTVTRGESRVKLRDPNTPCIHLGEQVGKLDCDCGGTYPVLRLLTARGGIRDTPQDW
jgi:hypothetical protein